MSDQSQHDHRKRLASALERTAPVTEFNAASLKRELERTSSDHEFEATPQQFLSKTSSDDSRLSTADRTETVTSFEESSQLLPDLETASTIQGEKRFDIVSQVGKGATSRVYAVADRSLGRTMAVKFLRRAAAGSRGSVRARFLHEARVTAMLEHPNITPIHDIGQSAKGELYFTMKNISGTTLGDAIRTAQEGSAVPGDFQSLDGRVRIVLKVCDALAYAHHRGFVHQDIKPDNIMLGEFGEVLLLDWGSAFSKLDIAEVSGRAMYGTPAYMSPEQARRECSDERSDVYCLAATFFHALTLRHPTWSDDAEEFWEKKRAGVIDPLSDAMRHVVPRPLLAIVLKAMAPDATQRYQSVTEFADELKRWQAGQAVRAYRESVFERVTRWYRNNRRVFWIGSCASVLVLAAAALFLREKVQEMLTWRRFFSDDFSSYTSTATLQSNWKSYVSHDWWQAQPQALSDSSYWQLVDGGAQGQFTSGFSTLTFAHAVPGDIRVEWRVTPLASTLNLNCFIGGPTRFDAYTFHIGGFQGDPSKIFLTRQRNFQPVDSGSFREAPRLNEAMRLRMEKEGAYVRLYRDNQRVIEWHDANPLGGPGHQTFGFEVAFFGSLRIDDVKVYYHPLPRKVSPIATADRFFLRGYFLDAAQHYDEIARMYPESDLGATALFKKGLSLIRLDSTHSALAAFNDFELRFSKHSLLPQSIYEQAKVYESQNDTAAAHELLRRLGSRYPGHAVLRAAINDMTNRRLPALVAAIDGRRITDTVDAAFVAWLEREAADILQWCRVFGVSAENNDLVDRVINELFSSNAYSREELVARYPEQTGFHAYMLLDHGRYEQTVALFPDNAIAAGEALYNLGRYEEVLRLRGARRLDAALALLELGRFEDILLRYSDQTDACAQALWRLGRIEEAMRRYPDRLGNLFFRLGHHKEYLHTMRGNEEEITGYLGAIGRNDTLLQIARRPGSMRSLVQCLRIHEANRILGRLEQSLNLCPSETGMRASWLQTLRELGRYEEALAMVRQHSSLLGRLFAEMGLLDSARLHGYENDIVRNVVLWSTADYDGIAAFEPSNRRHIAMARLDQGQYALVARQYADQRFQAASALLALGRDDELLKRYPDQRQAGAMSLLRRGLTDSAMQRFPEYRAEYAQWLIEQGRAEEVVNNYREHPLQHALALVSLGREHEIGRHPGMARLTRIQSWEVSAASAMRAWERGNAGHADSLLAVIELPELGWPAERFATHLLRPILAMIGGRQAHGRGICRRLVGQYPYAYGQRTRYDAQYLVGDIDESQYRTQPYRRHLEQRLALLNGVKAEAAGDSAGALQWYRQLGNDPHLRYPYLFDMPPYTEGSIQTILYGAATRIFVLWRLRALGAGSSEPELSQAS